MAKVRKKTVKFFVAYLRVLLEAILILPILYFFTIIILEDSHRLIILGSMVLYPVIGITVCKLFGWNKALRFIVGFILTEILAETLNQTYLTGVGEFFFNYILSFALFYRSMMYTEGEWIDLFPPSVPLVLIILDFLVLLIIGIAPVFEPYRGQLTVIGPFVIIGAIFVMNHLNIKLLSDTRGSVSQSGKLAVDKGMNIHNRLWVVIICIAIFLVSTWRNMIDVLKAIAGAIIGFIMMLMERSSGESVEGEGSGGGDMLGGLPPPEETANSPFWDKFYEIFTLVLGIVATIGIIVLIVIVLYKAIKAVSKMMKNLMDKEGSLIEDMGYVDSRESIMNLKDVPKEYLKKLKEKLEDLFAREPKYSEMKTVEEKATWLYRHTVIKSMSSGYKYKVSNTATETLTEIRPDYKGDKNDIDFIDDAYNKVKFSESLPDESQVDRMGNAKR